MNPWILIIAQYGLPAALEIKKLFAQTTEPTVEDFQKLVEQYATETLEQKLIKAQAAVKAAQGV